MSWHEWGSLWQVVATGNPLPGWKSKYVIERLVQRAGFDAWDAEEIVSGEPTILASELSKKDAADYADRLRDAGLEVELRATTRELGLRHRLFLGVFFVLAIWGYNEATDRLWHFQEVGATDEAAAQLAALLNSDLFPEANVRNIGELLERGQHDALHQLFDSLQTALLADHNLEISYDALVSKINANNGIRLSDLDQWIRETGSAYAYLARASYYRAAAWKRRGNRFIDRTPSEQIADFRSLFGVAVNDAYRALELNPQLLPAYNILIEADRADASRESVDDIVSRVERDFPWALRFRQLHLIGLEPKWGGSYTDMNLYIARVQPYLKLNPRLSILQGYVDASQGRGAHKGEKYGQCVSHYSDAIVHGVHSAWLAERADCLYHLKKYQLALQDIDLSLTIEESSRSRNIRSKILGALQ